MIKSLIRRLFHSNKKESEILRDLKTNPNFQTEKEIRECGINSCANNNFNLEKGKMQSFFIPDLGNQKGLILTKWYFKPGDIIKSGDIVCNIENENITMECESVFSGKLISTCRLNQQLSSGTEIFKIEGV